MIPKESLTSESDIGVRSADSSLDSSNPLWVFDSIWRVVSPTVEDVEVKVAFDMLFESVGVGLS